MPLEAWFDRYQYAVDYDIGESAVRTLRVEELDLDLGKLELRYGHHQGLPGLRELIATDYPGLSADDILVTTGASEAIALLASCLAEPGQHVVVEHPTYPTLYCVPRALGVDVELFSLDRADKWRPDWAKLRHLARQQTRYVALTHPNNPTGSVITESELVEVAEWAASRGLRLIVDETYRQLSYNLAPPPVATLTHSAVSVSTMSKCYGVPGLRVGWVATRDGELIARLLAAREHWSITNNTLGEHLAAAILADRDRHLARAAAHVARNLDHVRSWIAGQPRVSWVEPRAGVVGFPGIDNATEPQCRALYRTLAQDGRTFVVPGGAFELSDTAFRLGFGTDTQALLTGLDRLGALLGRLDTFAPIGPASGRNSHP
jgi:aspartate/methionine/tyrosine aminotransferase